MGLLQWFAPKTRVKIEIEGAHFEAVGEEAFVERALAAFLEQKPSKPGPAPALRAPAPIANDDDPTVKQRRTSFIRVHAIDGEIAKIYPLDGRRMRQGLLARLFNMNTVRNVYVEAPSLSRRLRGNQDTMWHALMPRVVSGQSARHAKS